MWNFLRGISLQFVVCAWCPAVRVLAAADVLIQAIDSAALVNLERKSGRHTLSLFLQRKYRVEKNKLRRQGEEGVKTRKHGRRWVSRQQFSPTMCVICIMIILSFSPFTKWMDDKQNKALFSSLLIWILLLFIWFHLHCSFVFYLAHM